jgi:hypothetical protein
MGSVKFVRYVIEGTERNDESGDLLVRSVVLIEAGKGISTTNTTSDGYFEQLVSVGGVNYSRHSNDESWDTWDGPQLIGDEILQQSLVKDDEFDYIGTVRTVGTEIVRGIETTHLVVETDMIAKAKIFWQDASTLSAGQLKGQAGPRWSYENGTQTMQYWIGVEDNLVYRMRVDEEFAAVNNAPAYGNHYEANFFDYNSTSVVAPSLE